MIDLRIPSPCHEDWNAMSPQSRGRHCASCDRVVVDVVAMTGAEAFAFMAGADAALARGDRVCVHARLDAHGQVVVPSPAVARGRARLLTNALAAMLAMSIAGCSSGPADGGRTSGQTQPVGGTQANEGQGAASPVHPQEVREGTLTKEGVVTVGEAVPGMLVAPPLPEPKPPRTGRLIAPEKALVAPHADG